MKKLLLLLVLSIMLLTPTIAFAHPANAIQLDYGWMGGLTLYLNPTPSGLVQGWQYDHPRDGDTNILFKPYNKFPNATTCDEGAVWEVQNWTAQGLYNTAYNAEEKADVLAAFPDLSQEYLLCKYPLD